MARQCYPRPPNMFWISRAMDGCPKQCCAFRSPLHHLMRSTPESTNGRHSTATAAVTHDLSPDRTSEGNWHVMAAETFERHLCSRPRLCPHEDPHREDLQRVNWICKNSGHSSWSGSSRVTWICKNARHAAWSGSWMTFASAPTSDNSEHETCTDRVTRRVSRTI